MSPIEIMARSMQDELGHWRCNDPVRPIYFELAIAAEAALLAAGYEISKDTSTNDQNRQNTE